MPPGFRDLLLLQLDVGRERAKAWPEMSAVQLPFLVHAAITGDEEPALPVAAACTIAYLGADLLDSVPDDELPPSWRSRTPDEVHLAAATFLAALPQLAMDHLREGGTPPAKLWRLTRIFTETLLTMGAGQHEDLIFSNQDAVSVRDVRKMVERKSGSANALFAKAGAVLATEDPAPIESYAAFGLYFGVAKQLVTDVRDIWGGDLSRDLWNGKRTLPVVHALTTSRGEDRRRLLGLLADATRSPESHETVRASLTAAGSVRYTALVVWLCKQRARDHLSTASQRGPAARELQELLDGVSLTERLDKEPVPGRGGTKPSSQIGPPDP